LTKIKKAAAPTQEATAWYATFKIGQIHAIPQNCHAPSIHALFLLARTTLRNDAFRQVFWLASYLKAPSHPVWDSGTLPFGFARFKGIGHIQRRDRHGFSPCSHFFIRPAMGRTAKLTQVSKEHATVYNRWCGQLQAKNRSLFKQQNTPVFSFLMTQSGCLTVFDSLIVSKNQTPSNTGIRP
jgi:hypothetical protein